MDACGVSTLTRHSRRRRFWLKSKAGLLGASPRCHEASSSEMAADAQAGGACTADKMLQAEQSGSYYHGLLCDSVDEHVDLGAMWGALESVAKSCAPSLRQLDSSTLARGLPFVLRRTVSSASSARPPCQSSTAEEVLLGTSAAAKQGAQESATAASDVRFTLSKAVAIREGKNGRGVYAMQPIAAGTTILMEKPRMTILDVENERLHAWAELKRGDAAALACSVARELKSFGSGVERLLAQLHPKEGCPIPTSEEKEEVSDDEGGESEVGSEEQKLEEDLRTELVNVFKDCLPNGRGGQIMSRIEAVTRLNGLGYYTNSEQICYAENYQGFTGTGLCLLASAFNHSCAPNTARFSVGDVLIFRTVAPIATGGELLISYIESETLREHRTIRRKALNRDFTCACTKCSAEDKAGAGDDVVGERNKQYLTVDSDLQDDLAAMPPMRRIKICRSLLRGELPKEFSDGEGEQDVHLRFKDAQELRTTLAVALTKERKFAAAWDVWTEAARLAAEGCPPFDEAVCVYALWAGLSAALVEEEAVAELSADGRKWSTRHLQAAREVHRAAFGGDVRDDAAGSNFFQLRFAREVELFDTLSGAPPSSRSSRERLRSVLESTPAPAARPTWETMRTEILSWNLPLLKKGSGAGAKEAAGKRSATELGGRNPESLGGGKAKKKARSKDHAGLANQTAAEQPARPKIAVVNGMRVLR
eukprot:TRINITY_DN49067_c0_g1_i1.p1 TRINITY_DN49067_c0_g1~~TRINITY_DN49067_c0_g1_i1.p1  ORF type:complete len:707 (-),score=161.09 TRINITY_DN49067_c0_g1_i1:49-2169(-)